MEYRREIDGLRALAVIPVILFHAGFKTFRGGFVGVDVFFVISGYLISSIILKEIEDKNFSLIKFYERRIRRIFPALFFVMMVSLPFSWLWLLPGDMKDFSKSLASISIFLSNVLFLRENDYFSVASELKPFVHAWSLSVEEQFYLIFPISMIFLLKLGRRWAVVALGVVFIYSFYLSQRDAYAWSKAAFFLLQSRIWELLVGVFAAFYLSNSQRRLSGKVLGDLGGWLGFALILYAVFSYSKATPFPGANALAPVFGALLIILFASNENSVGKFIGNEAFVRIGLISYSAYLWHQPLFAFARHRILNDPGRDVFILLSIMAFVMAYFSWRFIEVPFRNAAFLKRRGIFIVYFSLSFVFICVGLCGHISDGYKFRLSKEFDQFFLAQKDKNPRQAECHYSGGEAPSPENYCVLGNGKLKGLLLGDSHADALAFSLSQALSENGLSLRSITYNGCPPVEDVYRFDLRKVHKCYELNKKSFDYALRNDDVEYVVLLGRWSIYIEGTYFDNREGGFESSNRISLDVVENGVKENNNNPLRMEKLTRQYKRSVQRLLEGGKKVILVYPVPEVGFDVPRQLARLKMFGEKDEITTSYDVFMDRNRQVLEAFDSIPDNENLMRVRPDHIFCNAVKGGRCVTAKGSDIFYYDDDHLSNTGARLVAEDVIKAMKNR